MICDHSHIYMHMHTHTHILVQTLNEYTNFEAKAFENPECFKLFFSFFFLEKAKTFIFELGSLY